MAEIKKCWFCGTVLRGSKNHKNSKSDEHIIAQWLIDHLGCRDMGITFLRHDVASGGILEAHQQRVPSYVNGRVCVGCNSGWMSQLEDEVKPILVRLIADPRQLSNITDVERFAVARWTLKTIALLNRTSSFGNPDDPLARPVPLEHMRSAMSGDLPQGILIVAAGCPSDKISDGIQNASWAVPESSNSISTDDQERSYKIGISFRSLLLAVAYFPNPDYHYGLTKGQFAVLWTGNRGIKFVDGGVGEVPITTNSPVLESFLGTIFVVSRHWWSLVQNHADVRFVVEMPKQRRC